LALRVVHADCIESQQLLAQKKGQLIDRLDGVVVDDTKSAGTEVDGLDQTLASKESRSGSNGIERKP
jgi:hypothetical protein